MNDGEFLAVLGPSGSGKTTLLRIVAGLELADSGQITLHGKDIRGASPQARRTAMIFQDDALYPHKSVYANLAFPIRNRSRKEVAQGVRAMAKRLGIIGLLGAWPRQLSGGERQRVALARGMLRDPQIVLFDEPLAHIDAQVRITLREEIRTFTASFGGPVIYVTHDHAEAMALADRIAVVQAGTVMQCDTPQRVFDSPANTFVATFLGTPPMNLLAGLPGYCGLFGIRPEHVSLGRDGGDLRGTVRVTRRIAADTYSDVETEYGMLRVRTVPGMDSFASGTEIYLRFQRKFIRQFDPSSGEALPPR
ncbi:MAG: ABC transporter ATP-binding protein [Candidatus Eremiobacteraeota bacterium]|nr:ABC transporter ATP-binding protein [Candidatus Eremiobacteraeota bacterium]